MAEDDAMAEDVSMFGEARGSDPPRSVSTLLRQQFPGAVPTSELAILKQQEWQRIGVQLRSCPQIQDRQLSNADLVRLRDDTELLKHFKSILGEPPAEGKNRLPGRS
eukprot:7380642-Prymnesium_polylepis.1